MRIPQPSQKTSFRATQPSTPPSTVRTTGPQGTPGGRAQRKPGASGKQWNAGVDIYLLILVVIEIILTGGFRRFFRRVHGG